MCSSAPSSSTKLPDPDWPYCGVNLTIHNIIIPEERLVPTPSQFDDMDAETEMDLRIIGCELIHDSGILLRLPQVAMATAQVLYQRFFYSKSFVRHFYEHYAMACIFLSAKLEECPRRIRDVINVFHHMRLVRDKKPPTPVMLDQSYTNLKNQVIKAERRILKELGFCVHAKHPHKLVICYLQALDYESNHDLVQTAWNYMNDSLRTDIFVRFLPEAIACGCIYLASCKLNIPLPRHPAWWEMFGVSDDSVHEICLCLLRLYARLKPDVNKLETELTRLRKCQIEAKEREAEQKKNATILTPPSAHSDHSSGYVSPSISSNVNTQSSKQLKSLNDESKKIEGLKSILTNNIDLPSNSLLADALANAKAMAASISASKPSNTVSDETSDRAYDIYHRSLLKHPGTNGQHSDSEYSPLQNEVLLKNDSRQESPHSTNFRRIQDRIGIRPAAYSNIPSQQQAEVERKHKSSKKHKRRSLSTSSNSSDDRDQIQPSRNLGPNLSGRIYRQAANSSESESGDHRQKLNSGQNQKKYTSKRKRRHARSSSGNSRSSSTGSENNSHSNSPKHRTSSIRTRGSSPPAAYRLHSEKRYKSKHHSSKSHNGEYKESRHSYRRK